MSLNIKTAVTPENPTGYIRVAGNASNVTTASNVIYTNTTSELSATDVQDAIDELASKEVEISVDNKSIVKSNENIISCNAVSDDDIENLFAGSSIEPIIFSNDYYKKTETYSKDEVDEIVGDINSVLEAIV